MQWPLICLLPLVVAAASPRQPLHKPPEIKWRVLFAHAVDDGCKEACGEGVDSSCIPKCETEMYWCLDHNNTVASGAKLFRECKEEVTEKFKNFGSEWNSTHGSFVAATNGTHQVTSSSRVISAAERKAIEDMCNSACGTGVDSSCVPQCQTEMYRCLDHDTTPGYEWDTEQVEAAPKLIKECQDKVAEKYRSFGENWNKGREGSFLAKNTRKASCGTCRGCLFHDGCRDPAHFPTATEPKCTHHGGTWCMNAGHTGSFIAQSKSVVSCGACQGCLFHDGCRDLAHFPTASQQKCSHHGGTWCQK